MPADEQPSSRTHESPCQCGMTFRLPRFQTVRPGITPAGTLGTNPREILPQCPRAGPASGFPRLTGRTDTGILRLKGKVGEGSPLFVRCVSGGWRVPARRGRQSFIR